MFTSLKPFEGFILIIGIALPIPALCAVLAGCFLATQQATESILSLAGFGSYKNTTVAYLNIVRYLVSKKNALTSEALVKLTEGPLLDPLELANENLSNLDRRAIEHITIAVMKN